MARQIPEWRDHPYIYEDGLYYDKRGGTPCRTIEEAYRERYKKEISLGQKSVDPYGNSGLSFLSNGLVLSSVFITVVLLLEVILDGSIK